MEQVQAFKTDDGQLFATSEQARGHEFALQWSEPIATFMISPACPYKEGTHARMAQKVIIAWERWKANIPPTKTPIEDAGLDYRTLNILRGENIEFMEDAQAMGAGLLMLPNLGRVTYNRILAWQPEQGAAT